MHLAARGLQLLLLSAVLAIAGQWGDDSALRMLWSVPLALLLAGLCFESLQSSRAALQVRIEGPGVLLLGRLERLQFIVTHACHHDTPLQFAPVVPAGFAALGEPVTLMLSASMPLIFTREVTPVRLGQHTWPAIPVRLAGRLRLAWWSARLAPACVLAVAPDLRSAGVARVRGTQAGANARLRPGSGAELLQLRDYRRGDALTHVDWKSTARRRRLTTREYSEDQHLDVMLAIDAGRLSRARAGELDLLGVYANVAARFAQHAVQRDDRVGLLVFAAKPLSLSPPDRGARAVAALCRQLSQLTPQRGESEPLSAALRLRAVLRQRGLIVWLTDLEDSTGGAALQAAVRALMPPHLALLAGVQSEAIAALATQPARHWSDPWISLAAREELQRTRQRLTTLRLSGTPVVHVPQAQLEAAVFAEYEAVRLRRLQPPRHRRVRR